jgi:prepilin-type N-terminal cleavage/methylation domain-containing protein
MKPRRDGFTLIELMIVLVLIGLLATFAQTFLWRAKDRALMTSVKHDLKVLATQQESYFGSNLRYATVPTDINEFFPSQGVTVTITYAQTDGWAATATHISLLGRQCGLFTGNATATDAPPATQAGVIECN